MITKTKKLGHLLIAGAISAAIMGCQQPERQTLEQQANEQEAAKPQKPTAAEAKQFVEDAEKRIADISEYAGKAAWIAQTYINVDSQYIESMANKDYKLLGIELANGAAKFNDLELPFDVERKLKMLRLGLTLPAPAGQAEKASELAKIESMFVSKINEKITSGFKSLYHFLISNIFFNLDVKLL